MIGIKRITDKNKLGRTNLLCPMCRSRLCDISEKSNIRILKESALQNDYLQIRCHKCGSVYRISIK